MEPAMNGMNRIGDVKDTNTAGEACGSVQGRRRKAAALLGVLGFSVAAVLAGTHFSANHSGHRPLLAALHTFVSEDLGTYEREEDPGMGEKAAVILYRDIHLGMSRQQVESIGGRPAADASGLALFQLLEYPKGTVCVCVQMDQINRDHTWRVSEVKLMTDVSPAYPFGLLRRVKYGPVPACPLCSR